MTAARTILLTGHSGSGKTLTASRLAEERPMGIAGVLSVSAVESGVRRAIVARLLPDREDVALARRARPGAPSETTPPSYAAALDDDGRAVARLGPWDFSAQGIERVNRHLCRLVDERRSEARRHAMLIDEIGPLELVHGGGFLPGLRAVAVAAVPSVIVVRPSLVESIRAFFAACGGADAASRIAVVEISDPSESPRACGAVLAKLGGPDAVS